MVVDDVQHDRDAVGVADPDEIFEGVAAAVGGFDGEQIAGVVAPRAGAGELVDGHELDAVDAQRLEIGQALERPLERRRVARNAVREGAQMHLVHHQIFLGRHLPVLGALPLGFARIDDEGFVVLHGHRPGPRVAPAQAVDVELISVARARPPAVEPPLAGPVRIFLERVGFPAVEIAANADLRGVGRPDAKRDDAARPLVLHRGAHGRLGGLRDRRRERQRRQARKRQQRGKAPRARGGRTGGRGVNHGLGPRIADRAPPGKTRNFRTRKNRETDVPRFGMVEAEGLEPTTH